MDDVGSSNFWQTGKRLVSGYDYSNDFSSQFTTVITEPSVMEGYEVTRCQQDQEEASLFEVIASCTGGIIGLMNAIVVAVILNGGKKLRKATFLCICNLAVADMLAGILLLWIFGLQKVALPFRTSWSELVQKSIWAVTVWSSMFSQLVIAFDRYFCVTRREKRNKPTGSCDFAHKFGVQERKRMVKVGIVLTWMIPILTFVVPVTSTWNCADNCNCYKPTNSTSDVYYMICKPIQYCSFTNPPFTKASMLYLGLSLLLMPTLPCFMYARIYHCVNKSAKKVKYLGPTSSNTSYEPENRTHSRPLSLNVSNQDGAHRFVRVLPPSSFASDERAGAVHFDCETVDLTSPRNSMKGKRLSWFSKLFKKNENQLNNNRPRARARIRNLLPSSGTFSRTINRFKRKREMRLLRTLMILLIILVISTVPLGLLFIVSYTETDKRYVLAAKILLIVSLLNSMVNPWIYFWRFLEMRTALKAMFCRQF